MEQDFLEVFKNLNLRQTLKDSFEGVTLVKLANARKKGLVKLYISSDHIIPRKDKAEMERIIKNTFFKNDDLNVKIIESYKLSGKLSVSSILTAYSESMLYELDELSKVLKNCISRARFEEVSDDTVKIVLPDRSIIRGREGEILDYLSHVLGERFNREAYFSVEYELSDEDDDDEALKESLVEHRISDIVAAREREMSAKAERSGEDGKKNDTPKAGFKKDFPRREARGRKTAFRPEPVTEENPDLLYGRISDGDDEISPISDLVDDYLPVVIQGEIITDIEKRVTKNEKYIISFCITDYTDTVKIKLFSRPETGDELCEKLKKGSFIKVKGIAQTDSYDHELGITSPQYILKWHDFKEKRKDTSLEKRVELHCHTKASDMDGVSDVGDIVKCAYKWGHKAIAITDHGVVSAFTDANHAWEKLYQTECDKCKEKGEPAPDRQDFFKIIYGVEGYLVDDIANAVIDSKGQSFDDTYVVFDIETTGFSPVKNRIIEIGAVKIKDGKVTDRFSEFVNPGVPIPYRISKLTSITDDDVADARSIEEVLPEFTAFCLGAVLVAHNAAFDTSFIKENCKRIGLNYDYTVVDTLTVSRAFLEGLHNYKLDTVAAKLGVSLENHHRAVDDAECTSQIFIKLLDIARERGIKDLDDVARKAVLPVEVIRGLPSFHVIILAKNNIGRINLYTLVSKAHLEYFSTSRHKVPLIPKSEILKHREGLIIGSACEAGELYQALVEERGEDTIAGIVNFYDYLEIQPRGNNEFMLRDIKSEKYERFNTEEDILELNRQIVKLGEEYNKPVVATCDVHFLNPEDEVYRRIIMKGQGFEDADKQAPLYLHTTDEMLEEFGYLGLKKAREVVITNPNMIADMVESISPVRPDKCAPVIENSDELLKTICYNKAHEMYGPELPEVVSERLERELNSIIKNGFAVMYIIAQKLVWKSVEDGYLVGSRGSVGSSFVATMAGITEVNPLVPHYYCSECHFYDFDSEEVKKFRGMAGVDMPDRICPKCGAKLKKDGFDIPFETFLGFKGDKEPDIDLNFSGEYQSKAHRYTEVIFGAGQTFRAGTISTLADKTAYGYVKKYYEEAGEKKRDCEINRIVSGCLGVRRGTGQHPGGIIVLPVGEDINSFTPVQHPANDMTTDTVTTHFDYHSIDHNLLKLDILGHDDPTMIRMLQDLTGIDPIEIPLDDPKVMTLFETTEALGVDPSDIGGCELGCLGIPEFGTDFSMGMVKEAKPKYFSDLVRIAGLSHGTDVWLGNAQDLLRDGIATISTAICTRDDIMTYLIGKGVDPSKSFKIMENVRKGKVAKKKCPEWSEWKEDMLAHDVPEWYIGSCEKIQYMFPRAHAAAYVMMAWRIAYCKVYYPLAYYAAFFSIRAKAFNYATMCRGREILEEELKRLRSLDKLSNKEEDSVRDLRIVQEMYARGFEFMPLDIFKARARQFSIIDGKIMPALTSIDGLGESAADSIVEAAAKGPFLSRDDFKQRTKVSQTIVDQMADLGILGDIPESNQISLFDFA